MTKLYFKYGAMNSGKSMFLLATAHNFMKRNVPFLSLKSSIDNRCDINKISSRALGELDCITITPLTNIFNNIQEIVIENNTMLKPQIKWLLIDEVQFLKRKQIDELAQIVDELNINVMCFGLKTDFQTNLFEGSKRLLEIADSFEELKSTCSCGGKNLFNARIDDNNNIIKDGEQILIGSEDNYIAVCRKCYNKI